jgi:hypothetical protein
MNQSASAVNMTVFQAIIIIAPATILCWEAFDTCASACEIYAKALSNAPRQKRTQSEINLKFAI